MTLSFSSLKSSSSVYDAVCSNARLVRGRLSCGREYCDVHWLVFWLLLTMQRPKRVLSLTALISYNNPRFKRDMISYSARLSVVALLDTFVYSVFL
jgi:hypothetical protein